MTNEQFERWKDFALRMARTCFRRARRPTAKWIEAVVKDFFDGIDEADIPTIVGWDDGPSYIGDAVSELLYEYEPRRPECRGCSSTVSYRPERIVEPNADEPTGRYRVVGHGFDARNVEVCDPGCDCSDGHPTAWEAEKCQIWLAKRDALCRCDEIEQLFAEQWDEQWGGPVCCCIRAGLGCVSKSSAGVIGFTAGNLRKMYPEGVPDWVSPPDERLRYWPGDEINGTFVELPDAAGVVL